MRITAGFIICLFFSGSAFSGEIKLQRRNLDIGAARPTEGGTVRFVSERAGPLDPETGGATRKGRLHAGARSCLVQVSIEGKGRLVIDTNSDGDLADEQPLAAFASNSHGKVFRLDGVIGEFPCGETTIEIPLMLFLSVPRGGTECQVNIGTVFEGKAEILGRRIGVLWEPGKTPGFRPPAKMVESALARFVVAGDRLLTLSGAVLTKSGDLAVALEERTTDGYAVTEAPCDADFVFLAETGYNAKWATLVFPSAGEFRIPRDQDYRGYLSIRKTGADGIEHDLWVELGVLGSSAEPSLGEPRPLCMSLTVYRQGPNMVFHVKSSDAMGRKFYLSSGGVTMALPVMEIRGPDSALLFEQRMVWGHGGFPTCSWKVPDGFEGMELEAMIRVPPVPFAIKAEKLSFKP